MKKITVLAPAKINLFLDVCARRPDGYHDIESVMQTVTLYDRVEIVKCDETTEAHLDVFCRDSAVPNGAGNIVYRAAKAFFAHVNIPVYRVDFSIDKKIPVEAGLGGGSADAAAAIIGLDRLYETKLSTEQMCGIGVTVGADVPFCIKKGTATAEGIGEILTSCPPMPDCAFLIAMPAGSKISTAEAYHKIDAMPSVPHATLADVLSALRACDLEGLSRALYNKFEAVTPEETGAALLREKMLDLGAVGARMSGSGPSVFGIFRTAAEAKRAAEAFDGEARVFVCAPCRAEASPFEL